MALSIPDRFRTRAQFLRAFPADVRVLLKSDIQAAVEAADDWADAAATSYNNALPVAFRTAASPQLKAALLAYICMRRAGLLRAEED